MPLLDNPWLELPVEAPYVLPQDVRVVERFNSRAKEEHRIIVDLLPEPHIGVFDAPVVLLNLNPGYSDEDYVVHGRPEFRSALLKTIRGEPSAYPFYYMDPSHTGAGHRWWRQRLRPLIEATSAEVVGKKVLCVELFPYHSRQFAHSRISVPSQKFALELVRSAMSRRALLVVLRGYQYWSVEIRDLGAYQRLLRLNSPQNVTVSRGNCPQGFDEILRELSA
jgi:hypothetical protein